ncbi:AMP-binding protein [Lacinutrix neustonica]|uniref:AMP-binding protein n=1 Tax=Lacinutrix neustonica TaxID=2980107 RepID=A0A9E8MYY8_9FLAO|nr:AMP-binding protein [Lacinutrix neustonica]WAC03087.1 AMP-binding protein [Lacinutrix neustonica]
MTRLFDLLDHQLKNNPLEASISGRNSTGQWESYSTQKLMDTAEKAAAGLLKLGLVPGDKVAIVAYKNRPEWIVMDYAIQIAGMISIPLYPTISVSEYEYILNEAEVKAVFCGGLDLYAKLSETQKAVATLKHIYTFDAVSGNPFWESIFDTQGISSLEQIKSNIKGDDLVTIIYTSGTTGNPKGVMLSHANIMHVVKATAALLIAKPNEKVLSFLPICHVYERAVSFCYCYKGVSVFFCGTDNLSGPDGDLLAVRPVVFTTVPRLLEKIYEAIYNKGLAPEGTKRKLFFWALDLTDDYELDQQLSFVEKLKWKLADTLIFSKWRAALGGNIRQIITGAAPCPVKILRVFCAAGIPIREAYGLTETSPTLTGNSLEPNGTIIGTVGYAIEGVSLFIDTKSGEYKEDEGEILAHGPNVMLGYYKKP